MANLKIIIGASLSGLNRGLSKAKQKIRSWSKGVNNIFKTAFSFTGLAVGGGIIGTLGLIAKKAVQVSAGFEQTRVAYETMLGSAEKASVVLDQLTQFSTVTPFEPEQVYAAGKQLLAFGVTADQLIPSRQKIGDISAATGKDFNELAGIFGKIKTKGKAQAEELNQMAEAGIPIIQELARMYGVTAEEVYKMGSAGEIAFGDIEEAFENMTKEGGLFNGMMQKQSETLNGIMSTLVGNIANVGRAMADEWLPTLKEAAKLANTIANSFSEKHKAETFMKENEAYGPGTDLSKSAILYDNLAPEFIKDFLFGKNRKDLYIPGPTEEEQKKYNKNKQAKVQEKKDIKLAELEKLNTDNYSDKQIKEDLKESKKYADKVFNEQMKELENETKAVFAVQDKIQAMQDQIKIQKLLNEGKKKEAEIQKQLADAERAAGRELTADEKADITKNAGDLYKAENQKTSRPMERQYTSLERVGGYLSGGARSETKSLMEKTNSTLESIETIADQIKEKVKTSTSSNVAR